MRDILLEKIHIVFLHRPEKYSLSLIVIYWYNAAVTN